MPEFVTQERFYESLRDTVLTPNVGRELSQIEVRDIVHGLADLISKIALDGGSVRLGRLGTFHLHTTPAGPRWNPAKKKKFKGGPRKKIVFRTSKSTRELLNS